MVYKGLLPLQFCLQIFKNFHQIAMNIITTFSIVTTFIKQHL